MALPTSGPLSLSQIQTEFGGSNPIGLNEYYAGGGLVPAGTTGTNGAVPSSGQISIWNFYGTTAFTPYSRKATYTTNSTLVVPSPVTSILVKAWGASGCSYASGRYSGQGGYASAKVPVTAGNTLLVAVGGGGTSTGGTNGGGGGGGCGGGGYSGVFINNSASQANALIMAGGGGGNATIYANGGAGGGTNGNSATDGGGRTGGGGTQVAGGSSGPNATSASGPLQGGGGNSAVGCGGGGWYGGGAGGNSGGGGSGYIISSGTEKILATGTNGGSVPYNTDSDYVSPKGVAVIGNNSSKTNGNPGYVVIYY